MALVIVERVFDTARDFAELQARENAASWCLAAQRVRGLRSYFAIDRQHLVGVYDAPDAEAVRATQRTAELPAEHVWTATSITDRQIAAPQGYSMVVVQRALPEGLTRELVQQQVNAADGCAQRLRVAHFATFLSLDCTRMCCLYYSPDLESVRVVSREVGAPMERLWSAELIEAPP
jgi:hypothetical protein